MRALEAKVGKGRSSFWGLRVRAHAAQLCSVPLCCFFHGGYASESMMMYRNMNAFDRFTVQRATSFRALREPCLEMLVKSYVIIN
jgi:hypothetical protein